MKARILSIAAITAGALAIAAARPEAADPTFATDIAPILYRNCASCHRPNGMAPFSVLDYDSVAPRLRKFRPMVVAGRMPPWQADGPRGVFRNDRRLTDEEKATIVRWLETGAKPGDLANQPPKPTFDDGWEIGKPDFVVPMQEDYTVPASGEIEYQYFVIATGLTEEKWVQAIEIMPGARDVVHHVLVYARVPPAPADPNAAPPAPRPAGTPAPQPLFLRNRDHDRPPSAPRRDSTHPPPRQLGALIASTAPGTNVVSFPEGTAMRLRPGTVLTFQMHYTAHGMEMKDRTSVGFRFAKEMPAEEIHAAAFTNGAFVIPAGARDVAVPAELAPTQPVRIWGLLPHTHLRGTRWQYTLVRSDSTKDIVLDIPRYDFNWQTYYLFTKPLEMPAGSKLLSIAWYDNSSSNEHNPDATKEVRWGDQTWEEMQYTGFLYSVPSRRLRP